MVSGSKCDVGGILDLAGPVKARGGGFSSGCNSCDVVAVKNAGGGGGGIGSACNNCDTGTVTNAGGGGFRGITGQYLIQWPLLYPRLL